MAINVLEVLWVGAVNVARQVQIEIVRFDLGKRDHARVIRGISLLVECIDNFMDVLLAQAVLVALLEEAFPRINHENTLAGAGILLVEHDDAGRDTSPIEQVRRETNDSLYVPPTDDFPSDVGFYISTE